MPTRVEFGEMHHESICDAENIYPLIFLPKKCTSLETNWEPSDNVFIDVKISSSDTDGNEILIYSGLCNVKLIDTYNVNIQSSPSVDSPTEIFVSEEVEDEDPVIIPADPGNLQPEYNQSDEVWIDPCRSPYVYNRCDSLEPQQTHYSVYHQMQTTNCITLEQHNTYITKNIFNYKEAVQYATLDDDTKQVNVKRTKSPSKAWARARPHSKSTNLVYEDDELECGLFLSHLPEEIMIEKKEKQKKEQKFIDLNTENVALKQLMSSDIQSQCKQRKTILFLGQDSTNGQTIQKIAFTESYMECSSENKYRDYLDDNNPKSTGHKKYQCANCSRIFNKISEFKEHMVDHSSEKYVTEDDQNYICSQCGKRLKTREKFQKHCQGHGNPELECRKCHKVYASKFTLQAHLKLHFRKYPCKFCSKTFTDFERLKAHATKGHSIYLCGTCDYVANNQTELNDHNEIHELMYPTSETDQVDSLFDMVSDTEVTTPSSNEDWKVEESTKSAVDFTEEFVEQSKQETLHPDFENAEMAMSKDFFSIGKRNKKRQKSCTVCFKGFKRQSDLKRHLIEHVVRRTLAKTPVNRNGKLDICCEVCNAETFTKIDRYKAHLRDHAKLTLYQCTFCDKSFSDSSNFSKHKKIHGNTYFQCDLCKRKFNSKHMLIQHMEYHNKNPPINCSFCNKQFHFESMLNKHVKNAHTKELRSRFRCRFCHKFCKSLKEKWDHEWSAHSARKTVADCFVCDAKFRKYAELKRHCSRQHDMEIPTAKNFLNE